MIVATLHVGGECQPAKAHQAPAHSCQQYTAYQNVKPSTPDIRKEAGHSVCTNTPPHAHRLRESIAGSRDSIYGIIVSKFCSQPRPTTASHLLLSYVGEERQPSITCHNGDRRGAVFATYRRMEQCTGGVGILQVPVRDTRGGAAGVPNVEQGTGGRARARCRREREAGEETTREGRAVEFRGRGMEGT